jgi:hypothetical protein
MAVSETAASLIPRRENHETKVIKGVAKSNKGRATGIRDRKDYFTTGFSELPESSKGATAGKSGSVSLCVDRIWQSVILWSA